MDCLSKKTPAATCSCHQATGGVVLDFAEKNHGEPLPGMIIQVATTVTGFVGVFIHCKN